MRIADPPSAQPASMKAFELGLLNRTASGKQAGQLAIRQIGQLAQADLPDQRPVAVGHIGRQLLTVFQSSDFLYVFLETMKHDSSF
jgi:hypothetical protein